MIIPKPRINIDIPRLEKELQSKGYSHEEIEKILAGARDINEGRLYTMEEVYSALPF